MKRYLSSFIAALAAISLFGADLAAAPKPEPVKVSLVTAILAKVELSPEEKFRQIGLLSTAEVLASLTPQERAKANKLGYYSRPMPSMVFRPFSDAVDCTNTTGTPHVQSAVDASTNGTAGIPAGTCTWSKNIVTTDVSVNIKGPTCTETSTTTPLMTYTYVNTCTLTIIGDFGSNSNFTGAIVDLNSCSSSHYVTLSHMKIQMKANGNLSSAMVSVSCGNAHGWPEQVFRVHHVIFDGDPTDSTQAVARWFTANATNGLFDHNYVASLTAMGAGNVSALDDGGVLSTTNTYHHTGSLGDGNAVYFESNYFRHPQPNTGNGITDNYRGARYVFRFNLVYNDNVGHHGWDSGNRGVATFEYYGNTFIAELGVSGTILFEPRSGTGMFLVNFVWNQTGATGFDSHLMMPQYYAGRSQGDLYTDLAGLWYTARARGWYPTPPWSATPGTYNGMSSVLDTEGDNFVTGVNPIDGNQQGPDHMDAAYTRSSSLMATTSDSATITCSDCNFTGGTGDTSDTRKYILLDNFKRGHYATGCTWTSGNTTLPCTDGAFTAGDVGKGVSGDSRIQFAGSPPKDITFIDSITDSTHVVLHDAPFSNSSQVALFSDPFIKSVTNSTTAVIAGVATATQSNKNITIGFSDQGYPLADQPGRWYFIVDGTASNHWPIAGSGASPFPYGYTDANYEQLIPIIFTGNLIKTGAGTPVDPSPTGVFYTSTAAYMKADREWRDQVPAASFDGIHGAGYGTFSQMPGTCTVGARFLASDRGSWNTYGSGPQFLVYKCSSTNTWTVEFTPYAFPHPFNDDAGGSCTPDHLVWSTGPNNSTIGITFGSLAVSIYNSTGAKCSAATNTITVANKMGTCTSMTLTGSPQSGAATAGDLNLSGLSEVGTPGSCTLTATATSLTGADSGAFTQFPISHARKGKIK